MLTPEELKTQERKVCVKAARSTGKGALWLAGLSVSMTGFVLSAAESIVDGNDTVGIPGVIASSIGAMISQKNIVKSYEEAIRHLDDFRDYLKEGSDMLPLDKPE